MHHDPARVLDPRLVSLFGALDSDPVVWAVLRGDPADAAGADDIDLLVRRDHVHRYEVIAGAHGFTPAAGGRGTHRFAVHHGDGAVLLKLDVVTELAFGPGFAYVLPVGDACLDRSRWDGRTRRLAPVDEFWAASLHELLDKPRFDAVAWSRLRDAAEGMDVAGPVAGALARLLPDPWSCEQVLDVVRGGRAEDLLAVRAPLLRSWRQAAPAAVRSRLVRSSGQRLVGAARRRRTRWWLAAQRRPGGGASVAGDGAPPG